MMNTIDWSRILQSVPGHLHRAVLRVIPPLSPRFHKGQAGRICVIGGCLEYTGAPFYAADSALKCGADMSFVVCTASAATAIKSYSPELIVYPYLRAADEMQRQLSDLDGMVEESVESIKQLLPRVHAVVIGPGMGRDEVVARIVVALIPLLRERGVPILLDGDGLWLICQHIDLIRGYERAVLTPNPVEFQRLCKSVLQSEERTDEIRQGGGEHELMIQLCRQLGNVTVVRKGQTDLICNGVALGRKGQQQQQQQQQASDGATVLECRINGEMNRRPGGQGDLLVGACGVFSHWALWAAGERNVRMPWEDGSRHAPDTQEQESERVRRCLLVAMYGACLVNKCVGYSAFMDLKRGMTAPNMLERIPHTFEQIYPWRECGSGAEEGEEGKERGNSSGAKA